MMLRRPLAALVTALSAVATVALPLAGSAHAEGTCTLTPPSRISIYADVVSIPTSITGDCGGAYWVTDSGSVAVLDPSEDVNSPTIIVFDDDSPYGRRNWIPDGAVVDPNCSDDAGRTQRQQGSSFAAARKLAERVPGSTHRSQTSAAACESVPQNADAYTDIRLGQYAAISGTRNTASKVTFTVTSAIWSTGLDKLINRSATGELQTQYADGSWHKVGNSVTTGSNGKLTFSVGLPRRTWRFAVYSKPYAFDRVSTAITR